MERRCEFDRLLHVETPGEALAGRHLALARCGRDLSIEARIDRRPIRIARPVMPSFIPVTFGKTADLASRHEGWIDELFGRQAFERCGIVGEMI